MFRIDDPSAVGALPTPEAAGTEGYFTEGNPGGGVAATLVRASFLNMIQEEIRAVVVAGGLTPSKTTYNQLLTAIQNLRATGYASSLVSPAGYIKLPTWLGGLIIQWGTLPTSAVGGVATAFPLTFPNQPLSLVTGVGSNVAACSTFDSLTTSGFNINGWTTSTGARVAVSNAWWIAVGN